MGAAAHQLLPRHLSPLALQTPPRPGFTRNLLAVAIAAPSVPRLLSAYLAMGAAIRGPPAPDREFRTVDFLTWVDLEAPALVAMQRRGRYLVKGSAEQNVIQ